VSNAIVAVAPNFALVLIARMLFGATLGAFWTVVSPVGPKLLGAQVALIAQMRKGGYRNDLLHRDARSLQLLDFPWIVGGRRHEMTITTTKQTNRLQALLLSGNEGERQTSRGPLNDTELRVLARRRAPSSAPADHLVGRQELRRLATAIRALTAGLAENKKQLATIVAALTPALLAA
jgi:hypothetical protein